MAIPEVIKDLKEAFSAQDDAKCAELTKKALEAGADPLELLEKYLLVWTKELCSKSFLGREYFDEAPYNPEEGINLSDVIMIAECLTACVDIIRPAMTTKATKAELSGKIVLGTVEGDVHDIGKSIIGAVWAAAGYSVLDIGYDVPSKTFALEAKAIKADMIGISCSLSMSRVSMSEIVNELKNAGIRDKVKVISGGQASFPSDVKTYGVDAHGIDVTQALTSAEELMRILKEERTKNKEVGM